MKGFEKGVEAKEVVEVEEVVEAEEVEEVVEESSVYLACCSHDGMEVLKLLKVFLLKLTCS